MNKRILLWDTEVSPAIVAGYGNKWDFRYVKQLAPQQLMCYSYKYLGEKKTYFVSMHDYATQKELVQSLAALLDEADITVAHNGINFDDKMANTFFILNDIDKPSPSKSVDTLRVARRKFRFPSNSLNDLGEYLGFGGKAETTYGDVWEKFLEGDRQAAKLMRLYNNRDVDLLEKIYLKFLPYITNHPNMGVYLQHANVCPHCGKEVLQSRGVAYRVAGEVNQYWCNKLKGGCGTWSYDRIATKAPKEVKSNRVSGQ